MEVNMQPDAGADVTEKPLPNSYKTYAVEAFPGKSLANTGPSPANKRGVEPTMVMKDFLGLAHVNPPTEVK
jgi:hypothetical protein